MGRHGRACGSVAPSCRTRKPGRCRGRAESRNALRSLVGFLFPRRCGRTSREHCPHCQGGEIDDDPYFLASERSIYPNYGYYGGSSWGSEYTEDLTPAEAQPGEASNYDFTEADAAAFAVTSTDFEQDLDAS
ncbi:MAG: hypothetical protein HC838_01010 [Spirulinaceae cyanobacterium RM2_2_10]|nr:hypothetical protein [Spirulinaceae cyanobacterium RM2_2_10]